MISDITPWLVLGMQLWNNSINIRITRTSKTISYIEWETPQSFMPALLKRNGRKRSQTRSSREMTMNIQDSASHLREPAHECIESQKISGLIIHRTRQVTQKHPDARGLLRLQADRSRHERKLDWQIRVWVMASGTGIIILFSCNRTLLKKKKKEAGQTDRHINEETGK